jgi:hypothetical protein
VLFVGGRHAADLKNRKSKVGYRKSIVARMAAAYSCNLFGLGRLFPVKSIVSLAGF